MLLVRVVYRCCYVIGVATGTAAARLATDFRTLGTTRPRLAPLAVVLQLTLLACWLVVRPISLTAFTACFALAPRLQAQTSRA
jgi:hypothetical protein